MEIEILSFEMHRPGRMLRIKPVEQTAAGNDVVRFLLLDLIADIPCQNRRMVFEALDNGFHDIVGPFDPVPLLDPRQIFPHGLEIIKILDGKNQFQLVPVQFIQGFDDPLEKIGSLGRLLPRKIQFVAGITHQRIERTSGEDADIFFRNPVNQESERHKRLAVDYGPAFFIQLTDSAAPVLFGGDRDRQRSGSPPARRRGEFQGIIPRSRFAESDLEFVPAVLCGAGSNGLACGIQQTPAENRTVFDRMGHGEIRGDALGRQSQERGIDHRNDPVRLGLLRFQLPQIEIVHIDRSAYPFRQIDGDFILDRAFQAGKGFEDFFKPGISRRRIDFFRHGFDDAVKLTVLRAPRFDRDHDRLLERIVQLAFAFGIAAENIFGVRFEKMGLADGIKTFILVQPRKCQCGRAAASGFPVDLRTAGISLDAVIEMRIPDQVGRIGLIGHFCIGHFPHKHIVDPDRSGRTLFEIKHEPVIIFFLRRGEHLGKKFPVFHLGLDIESVRSRILAVFRFEPGDDENETATFPRFDRTFRFYESAEFIRGIRFQTDRLPDGNHSGFFIRADIPGAGAAVSPFSGKYGGADPVFAFFFEPRVQEQIVIGLRPKEKHGEKQEKEQLLFLHEKLPVDGFISWKY